MAGPPYVTPPPPLPPTGYHTPPPSRSPTTHVTVIVIVVPIVGVICLGLLAALLFVLWIRRRLPGRGEEGAKVDEVEVKVTEHVRIVEGVVGEAGKVEAYKASGCGDGDGCVGEAGVVVVAGWVVVVERTTSMWRIGARRQGFTEASQRERE